MPRPEDEQEIERPSWAGDSGMAVQIPYPEMTEREADAYRAGYIAGHRQGVDDALTSPTSALDVHAPTRR